MDASPWRTGQRPADCPRHQVSFVERGSAENHAELLATDARDERSRPARLLRHRQPDQFQAGISDEMAERLVVRKCNVDEEPDLATKFRIVSIPTLILFKNGKPAAQQVGAPSEKALRDWLDQQLAAGTGP